MRKKVESRCFIDDETPTTTTTSRFSWGAAMPLERLTFVMGILLIVSGLLGVFMGFITLYIDLDTRMATGDSTDYGYGSLILATLKVAAACITVGTGIFVLRNRSDAERIKTAREKLGIAIKIYLVGVAVYIVGLFFALQGLSMLVTMLTNFFCLLCLPFLWLFALSVEKRLNGEKSSPTPALVLSIITSALLSFLVVMSLISPLMSGS